MEISMACALPIYAAWVDDLQWKPPTEDSAAGSWYIRELNADSIVIQGRIISINKNQSIDLGGKSIIHTVSSCLIVVAVSSQ
jgi:hypothetical protein